MRTGLLTDHYELTMVSAALRSGAASRRAVFEMFARELPGGRRYGVVAGTGRFLRALEAFTFSAAEIDFLRGRGIIDDATAGFLTSYRFGGSIWGYAEGDCYFPGSPILVVDATFAEAVVLETLALSIFNHDCAIASAASRMVTAASGRPIIEMGSRRTHERAAVAAARAAYLSGFAMTSNLRAGYEFGVPTAGTSAHAFTMVHDDERQAFGVQLEALGKGTTLLVDTYDVSRAVRTAVELAGPDLGAVRIDSGDLREVAHAVRAELDSLGATGTRIVITGDLDEYAIAALASAPVNGYGVGTALVTGSGVPTAALVYKLVARADRRGTLTAVAKRSVGKPTIGGRKWAVRTLDATGAANAEVISAHPPGGDVQAQAEEPVPRGKLEPGSGPRRRVLLRQLVRDGQIVGAEPLAASRERHQHALRELPRGALRLSSGDPAIPTVIRHRRETAGNGAGPGR
ncbi:MAG: nicotinate phosphoribosyltransferase [Streptosporangiaceae bacterium]